MAVYEPYSKLRRVRVVQNHEHDTREYEDECDNVFNEDVPVFITGDTQKSKFKSELTEDGKHGSYTVPVSNLHRSDLRHQLNRGSTNIPAPDRRDRRNIIQRVEDYTATNDDDNGLVVTKALNLPCQDDNVEPERPLVITVHNDALEEAPFDSVTHDQEYTVEDLQRSFRTESEHDKSNSSLNSTKSSEKETFSIEREDCFVTGSSGSTTPAIIRRVDSDLVSFQSDKARRSETMTEKEHKEFKPKAVRRKKEKRKKKKKNTDKEDLDFLERVKLGKNLEREGGSLDNVDKEDTGALKLKMKEGTSRAEDYEKSPPQSEKKDLLAPFNGTVIRRVISEEAELEGPRDDLPFRKKKEEERLISDAVKTVLANPEDTSQTKEKTRVQAVMEAKPKHNRSQQGDSGDFAKGCLKESGRAEKMEKKKVALKRHRISDTLEKSVIEAKKSCPATREIEDSVLVSNDKEEKSIDRQKIKRTEIHPSKTITDSVKENSKGQPLTENARHLTGKKAKRPFNDHIGKDKGGKKQDSVEKDGDDKCKEEAAGLPDKHSKVVTGGKSLKNNAIKVSPLPLAVDNKKTDKTKDFKPKGSTKELKGAGEKNQSVSSDSQTKRLTTLETSSTTDKTGRGSRSERDKKQEVAKRSTGTILSTSTTKNDTKLATVTKNKTLETKKDKAPLTKSKGAAQQTATKLQELNTDASKKLDNGKKDASSTKGQTVSKESSKTVQKVREKESSKLKKARDEKRKLSVDLTSSEKVTLKSSGTDNKVQEGKKSTEAGSGGVLPFLSPDTLIEETEKEIDALKMEIQTLNKELQSIHKDSSTNTKVKGTNKDTAKGKKLTSERKDGSISVTSTKNSNEKETKKDVKTPKDVVSGTESQTRGLRAKGTANSMKSQDMDKGSSKPGDTATNSSKKSSNVKRKDKKEDSKPKEYKKKEQSESHCKSGGINNGFVDQKEGDAVVTLKTSATKLSRPIEPVAGDSGKIEADVEKEKRQQEKSLGKSESNVSNAKSSASSSSESERSSSESDSESGSESDGTTDSSSSTSSSKSFVSAKKSKSIFKRRARSTTKSSSSRYYSSDSSSASDSSRDWDKRKRQPLKEDSRRKSEERTPFHSTSPSRINRDSSKTESKSSKVPPKIRKDSYQATSRRRSYREESYRKSRKDSSSRAGYDFDRRTQRPSERERYNGRRDDRREMYRPSPERKPKSGWRSPERTFWRSYSRDDRHERREKRYESSKYSKGWKDDGKREFFSDEPPRAKREDSRDRGYWERYSEKRGKTGYRRNNEVGRRSEDSRITAKCKASLQSEKGEAVRDRRPLTSAPRDTNQKHIHSSGLEKSKIIRDASTKESFVSGARGEKEEHHGGFRKPLPGNPKHDSNEQNYPASSHSKENRETTKCYSLANSEQRQKVKDLHDGIPEVSEIDALLDFELEKHGVHRKKKTPADDRQTTYTGKQLIGSSFKDSCHPLDKDKSFETDKKNVEKKNIVKQKAADYISCKLPDNANAHEKKSLSRLNLGDANVKTRMNFKKRLLPHKGTESSDTFHRKVQKTDDHRESLQVELDSRSNSRLTHESVHDRLSPMRFDDVQSPFSPKDLRTFGDEGSSRKSFFVSSENTTSRDDCRIPTLDEVDNTVEPQSTSTSLFRRVVRRSPKSRDTVRSRQRSPVSQRRYSKRQKSDAPGLETKTEAHEAEPENELLHFERKEESKLDARIQRIREQNALIMQRQQEIRQDINMHGPTS